MACDAPPNYLTKTSFVARLLHFSSTASTMSATSPIILILGARPRVGTSVAKAFAAKGFKVALASRKASEADNSSNEIHIQSDFADPGTFVNIFSQVKSSLGIPSVVVTMVCIVALNRAGEGSTLTPTSLNDPLSLQLAYFNKDFNINTRSTPLSLHNKPPPASPNSPTQQQKHSSTPEISSTLLSSPRFSV